MNGTLNQAYIIGIKLRKDGFTVESTPSTIVGSVICNNLSITCDAFRKQLENELKYLPENYTFLSKHGFPIDKTEELRVVVSQLILSDIVTIQRHFTLPRLGVKWHDGEYLGFIFINFKKSLTEARAYIDSNLIEKSFTIDSNYGFLDKNGWPVSTSQEQDLIVWDICYENSCTITQLSTKRKQLHQDHKIKKKSLNKRANTTIEKSSSLSILISYVHAEASTHARDLKSELQGMGIESVFLDVDDIKAGHDWQDVINAALNDCTAFVALVTPRYGETRWTNREAKLADGKEKLIIPVSFLKKEDWPPDHLAIQFFSLQYIDWKQEDDFIDNDDYLAANDITHWNQRCVHRVAKEIKKLCFEKDASTPDSSSHFDSSNLAGNGYTHHTALVLEQPNSKKHLIVISAHCEQKSFVIKLEKALEEENYRVWSSINSNIEGDEVYNMNEDSQLSESSPSFDSYTHVKNKSSYLGNCEVDYSLKAESKLFPCSWKEASFEGSPCRKSLFKKMIKNASLVILIISDDFNKSPFCKQQAFYCEQRVEVIVIKYGKFQIDNILSNLYPEQDMLETQNFEDAECDYSFVSCLKKEISKTIESFNQRNSYKDHIQNKVAELKNILPTESCIYIIGGTNCVSKNAEEFCRNLGSELAKVKNLNLVTEGFFGVGDLVGKSYCEEREILAKGKPQGLYHVIPYKDENITKRARQSDDGSFQKIPYGQTIFFGDSISERDDIVSSTFKMCIFIEGGERSASLAEKFLWNDCTVIPIIFNNRAISSKVCLTACISKPPCGVNSHDWCKLDANHYDVEELVATVKRIVYDLLKTRPKFKKTLSNLSN